MSLYLKHKILLPMYIQSLLYFYLQENSTSKNFCLHKTYYNRVRYIYFKLNLKFKNWLKILNNSFSLKKIYFLNISIWTQYSKTHLSLLNHVFVCNSKRYTMLLQFLNKYLYCITRRIYYLRIRINITCIKRNTYIEKVC